MFTSDISISDELLRCGQILKWFIKQTEKLKKVFCIALLPLYNTCKKSFRRNAGKHNSIWVLYNDFLGS